LAKDRVLNSLASSYLEGGVRDTFSIQDLTLSELAGLKGEKLLLPIHFATILNSCGYEEEEVLGCGAGRLVWQSGKGGLKRPTPDKLSYGQFFEASARILNLLSLDQKSYEQYLDYLRQLGILLQTFTAGSVFTLDHLHRHYVHETGSVWNIIENSLENTVLKKKEDVNRYQNASQPRKSDFSVRGIPASRSSNAMQPAGASYADNVAAGKTCWLFNLYKGCHYGDKCTYPHVCSVDGCRQAHPAYKHSDNTHERPRPGAPQFKPSS
jgi:hypothetical protein